MTHEVFISYVQEDKPLAEALCRDVEAGRNAGCQTIFIARGYNERQPQADRRVQSLSEAVDWILKRSEDE